MITREQLDQLGRAAEAAEDAYLTALDAEHMSMMSRYQPALLSPRLRALKDASDTALLRRSHAISLYDRAAN
jgi:hypothetical protein